MPGIIDVRFVIDPLLSTYTHRFNSSIHYQWKTFFLNIKIPNVESVQRKISSKCLSV